MAFVAPVRAIAVVVLLSSLALSGVLGGCLDPCQNTGWPGVEYACASDGKNYLGMCMRTDQVVVYQLPNADYQAQCGSVKCGFGILYPGICGM